MSTQTRYYLAILSDIKAQVSLIVEIDLILFSWNWHRSSRVRTICGAFQTTPY
jgi:hypothetical protein